MNPEIKKINLEINRNLENWKVYHALREIIANALDEQYVTGTKDIDIFEDEKHNWHIRDFGRGIKREYFSQAGSSEKLSNPKLIGKLGIGLQEALATFEHNNVKVIIKSRYGLFALGKSIQDASKKILPLIYIYPPKNTTFLGTEFIFKGISNKDIEQAKNLFLKFSKAFVLENTDVGQVIRKNSNLAAIYINGVKIAEENNFLFSYNITSLNSKILKVMRHERPNVGRSAYTDRVRAILVSCSNQEVAQQLINDLSQYAQGTNHDELRWLDVQENAVKILNPFSKVIFLTSDELENCSKLIDKAQADGYEFINIPGNLKQHINGANDITGTPIRDIEEFYNEYKRKFRYCFVDPQNLFPEERQIFNMTPVIFDLLGGKPALVQEIKISENMIKELDNDQEATGVWDPLTKIIIIKRSELQNIKKYAGTLLHQLSHAISGDPDEGRRFETELTRILGGLTAHLIERKQLPEKIKKTRFWHNFFKKRQHMF